MTIIQLFKTTNSPTLRFPNTSLQRVKFGLTLLFLIALAPLFIVSQSAKAIEIQRVISPGGIEAWLVEERSLPIITFRYGFQSGGAVQDPTGKEGLAYLMSGLLDEGAGGISSQDFQGELNELSMSLWFSSGRDTFYGYLQTLTPNKDRAFELLRIAVNEPHIDEEPFERIRTQIITSIQRNETDPDSIASKEISKLLYPDHTYERPVRGTVESLENITPEDIRQFRKKIFGRDNLKIGVVGDISAEELGILIDKVFLTLPEESNLDEVSYIIPESGGTEIIDLDIPQTIIRYALPGLERHDPDYFAAYLMSHILGESSFTSWLYDEIREKRGLAYGIYISLDAYDHSGTLAGRTSTRPENVQEVIELIKQQIHRMATVGPTQEELDAAKTFLTGSYALRFDTSEKIAGQLLGIQLTERGFDYINVRNSKVEKVTLEDVKRIAQQMLQNVEPTFVIVGKQS